MYVCTISLIPYNVYTQYVSHLSTILSQNTSMFWSRCNACLNYCGWFFFYYCCVCSFAVSHSPLILISATKGCIHFCVLLIRYNTHRVSLTVRCYQSSAAKDFQPSFAIASGQKKTAIFKVQYAQCFQWFRIGLTASIWRFYIKSTVDHSADST